MIEYSVEITDAAFVAIRKHTRYIAVESQSPENAKRSSRKERSYGPRDWFQDTLNDFAPSLTCL